MEIEQAHSPLGPSSAERWLNCPASVRATAGMPDTESEYAKEGTIAHNIVERCQIDNASASAYLGYYVFGLCVSSTPLKSVAPVTQEMVDAVQEFLDYVNGLDGDALSEYRVKLDPYVPNGFGTLDDARLEPYHAEITDFKYGKGVQVFAKDNVQLMCYAIGVYNDWNWLYDFKTFRLNIVQPRLDHIDEWLIETPALLKWAEEVLKPGAIATTKADAPFNPGSWCQFCKIKATCKARAESVFKAVVGEFEDLDTAIGQTPMAIPGLTPDQIAHALDTISNVKKWCADIEKHALAEIMQGRAVGEYKIVEGRSNQKWTDENLVLPIWTEAGFDEDSLLPRKMIGPSAAMKVVGKKHPVYKSLQALSVKPIGKPKLAPGSDPRPAMVIDPNTEFENLGEDE